MILPCLEFWEPLAYYLQSGTSFSWWVLEGWVAGVGWGEGGWCCLGRPLDFCVCVCDRERERE